MHTWKILSACPLLNTDKNMSVSLPIALSLSLHLALSACLKIPYVIFIISLFLFFFFTLEAYWATRWKDLPQVTLYLFIESEWAEKARVNWGYEKPGMTGQVKRKKTTDDARLVETTGRIVTRMREETRSKSCSFPECSAARWIFEMAPFDVRSISSDHTYNPARKAMDLTYCTLMKRMMRFGHNIRHLFSYSSLFTCLTNNTVGQIHLFHL